MVAEEGVGATYRASAGFSEAPSDALVIACSDARFREATNEFLGKRLGLRSWETISVPGGAYMLSFADALPKQLKVGMRMVRSVLRGHGPSRIVLLGHEQCARYVEGFASKLRRPGFVLSDKQKHDLRSVAKELAAAFPDARVEAHFARLESDTVVFEKL